MHHASLNRCSRSRKQMVIDGNGTENTASSHCFHVFFELAAFLICLR